MVGSPPLSVAASTSIPGLSPCACRAFLPTSRFPESFQSRPCRPIPHGVSGSILAISREGSWHFTWCIVVGNFTFCLQHRRRNVNGPSQAANFARGCCSDLPCRSRQAADSCLERIRRIVEQSRTSPQSQQHAFLPQRSSGPFVFGRNSRPWDDTRVQSGFMPCRNQCAAKLGVPTRR